MAEQFEMHNIWVPGHIGIEGSCTAEESARKGTSTPLTPGRTHIKMSMATCSLLLRNHYEDLANNRWQNLNISRVVRLSCFKFILNYSFEAI